MTCRRRLFAGSVIFAAVALLVGCVPPPPVPSTSPPDEQVQTVRAERRDIVSVLVVEGKTVSSPEFYVASPTSGVITYVQKTVGAPAIDAGAIAARVNDTNVALPVPGRVVSTAYPQGAAVVGNAPLLTEAYAGFGIVATVPSEQLYRIYEQPTEAVAAITGGPAGVICELFPAPAADSSAGSGSAVACVLPLDTGVVAGLPAKIGMQTASHASVLALPVTAVLGSAETGQVTLVKGGKRTVVTVQLGISDGSYVEILGGIEEGDTVLSHVPGLA